MDVVTRCGVRWREWYPALGRNQTLLNVYWDGKMLLGCGVDVVARCGMRRREEVNLIYHRGARQYKIMKPTVSSAKLVVRSSLKHQLHHILRIYRILEN